MDLSQVPTEHLIAFKQGDLSSIPTETLIAMKGLKNPPASPVSQQEAPQSLKQTVFDQSMQGATFGFADEGSDPLGAVIATARLEPMALLTGEATNPALVEVLAGARQGTQNRLTQQMQQRPVASITSQIAGSLLTGAAGATTKTGAALGNLVRSGNAGARIAKGAATGAVLSGLYGAGSAEEGNRAQGASEAAIYGGLVGGAIPATGAALKAGKAAITPAIDDGLRDVAKLARQYNIPISFDQVSSSRALKNAQKVSQELPFSGQEKFREGQLKAWNKAIFKTVGLDADKFTKINMDKAFTQVGHEFDSLAKGKTFQFDDAFARRLDDIRQEAASTANRDAIGNFEDAVTKALKEAGPMGEITGEKLGKLRSTINRMARKASNIDTQSLLHDLENAIIDVMTEGDDVAKGSLSAAKQKYKNLIVIEPLAAKAKGGNISPSLLNNRVSQIYGRSHTRGQAGEIGDLAQVGFELLPELGGSDTVQKGLYAMGGLGATGGIIANPVVGVPTALTAAAGLAVNRVAQSGLNRNQKMIDKALSLSDVLRLPPGEAQKILTRDIAKTK